MTFQADGDRHFNEDGRIAEIKVDPVGRAMAKMAGGRRLADQKTLSSQ